MSDILFVTFTRNEDLSWLFDMTNGRIRQISFHTHIMRDMILKYENVSEFNTHCGNARI